MNELTVIIPQEKEEITASAEEQANEVKLIVPNQTGDNGATFIPSVSADGVISWTNDKGLPNPEPVNIKGAPGKDGYNPVKGKDYFDGKNGYTPVKGTDYFTEADKAEMVSAVISALPKYNGEVVAE